MKIMKLIFFNLSFLTVVFLYCGLLFSLMSVYPKYQPLLMSFFEISAASMPLDILKSFSQHPLLVAAILIMSGSISVVIYRREEMK